MLTASHSEQYSGSGGAVSTVFDNINHHSEQYSCGGGGGGGDATAQVEYSVNSDDVSRETVQIQNTAATTAFTTPSHSIKCDKSDKLLNDGECYSIDDTSEKKKVTQVTYIPEDAAAKSTATHAAAASKDYLMDESLSAQKVHATSSSLSSVTFVNHLTNENTAANSSSRSRRHFKCISSQHSALTPSPTPIDLPRSVVVESKVSRVGVRDNQRTRDTPFNGKVELPALVPQSKKSLSAVSSNALINSSDVRRVKVKKQMSLLSDAKSDASVSSVGNRITLPPISTASLSTDCKTSGEFQVIRGTSCRVGIDCCCIFNHQCR